MKPFELDRLARPLVFAAWAAWGACIALAAGCRQEMYDQPYLEPLEPSAFFPDGMSARPEIPGTVPRGYLERDELLEEGILDGRASAVFPFEIDMEVLERGRLEYRIYCAPCHGESGYGNGTIVRRGFPAPPSFHTETMRAKPPGHYVHVITNGFGIMYDYASRLRPRDRWAVAAFIQALQLSQSAAAAELSPEERDALPAGEAR